MRHIVKQFLVLVQTLVWCLMVISAAHSSPAGLVMKVDKVTLNTPALVTVFPPVSVTFGTPFSVPPVVFLLPDNSNPQPATARVISVSSTGFEFAVSEAEGGDATTIPPMSVNYLAIEPGDHTLPDGTRLLVGRINVSTSVGKNDSAADTYTALNFAPVFPTIPTVILELQTINNDPGYASNIAQITSPWLEVAARNLGTNNIQVSLERAETSNGTVTVAESVGYAVMVETTGTFVDSASNTITYESFLSADSVTGNCVNIGNPNSANPATFANTYAVAPLLVANQVTRDGGDGGWAQHCGISTSSVQLTVEEDLLDGERTHTTESLGVMVFSEVFDLSSPGMQADVVTTSPVISTMLSLNFTNVTFPNAFESAPLIFPMPTDEGADPTALRIRNVSTTGFEIAQVVPTPQTLATDSMTVDYIAITEGVHTLGDGTVLEAGTFLTNNTMGIGDTAGAIKTFSHTFTGTPSLIAQIQSKNSEPGLDPNNPSTPWMVAAVKNVTNLQAEFALDRLQVAPSEPATITIANETIGYLAAEQNLNQTLISLSGTDIFIKTFNYGEIQGLDDGDGFFESAIPAPNPFSSTPIRIAHTVTRNGSDGLWMRRCAISPTNIGLFADEDIAADAERGHIAETASVFMFSESFEWCPLGITVLKSLEVISDPINIGVNPKVIPGALLQYTINVENDGAVILDAGLLVKDIIPNNVELFVGNLDGSGSPVIFTEGGSSGDPSGVGTPNFVSLASTSDDIEFSNDDAATFTYVPTPTDGYDENVTNIRVRAPSAFNAKTPTTDPAFSITFQVRVK